MNEKQIMDLVRKYLVAHQSDVLNIEIVGEKARYDGSWWYVPVRAIPPPQRAYPYYEELMDVEDEIKTNEQIDVMLVPA